MDNKQTIALAYSLMLAHNELGNFEVFKNVMINKEAEEVHFIIAAHFFETVAAINTLLNTTVKVVNLDGNELICKLY